MKYTDAAQSGTAWAATSFGDSSWTAANAGTFPNLVGTRYYRFTTTLTTGHYALRLDFKTRSGLVAYVNGQEALRVGLPAYAPLPPAYL